MKKLNILLLSGLVVFYFFAWDSILPRLAGDINEGSAKSADLFVFLLILGMPLWVPALILIFRAIKSAR